MLINAHRVREIFLKQMWTLRLSQDAICNAKPVLTYFVVPIANYP